MSRNKTCIGGGGALNTDYKILLSFLEQNYEVKTQWRREKGLVAADRTETIGD